MKTKYPLLDAREKTDAFEKKILADFPDSTLIVIRANMPGEKKGCIESDWIVYTIFLECKRQFKPEAIFSSYTNEEGLIFFLSIKKNPIKLKRSTVKIEEKHPLGRLADIDVLTLHKLFSRTDLSRKNKLRKCFLCGEPAVHCTRTRRHSKQEIINFINEKVYSDFLKGRLTDKLASFSEAAMLAELCRMYGFGCVTANGTGSHSDMDFLLMLKCIPLAGKAVRALTEKKCASFSALRKWGRKIESKLFKITNGVNTYKGAFFLILILNACTYRILKKRKSFDSLREEISAFSWEVKKDFEEQNCSPASLHGFLQTGNCGIRSDVLSGFEEHFLTLLPLLKKEPPYSIEKIIVTIISKTFDTTVIKRKNLKTLNELQKKAETVLSCKDSDFNGACAAFSVWCENEHISTGGSADRLIVLYNLFLLKKFFKNLI